MKKFKIQGLIYKENFVTQLKKLSVAQRNFNFIFSPLNIIIFEKWKIGCKFFYDRNVHDFYELFQIKSKPNALQKSNQVYFGPFTCNFK